MRSLLATLVLVTGCAAESEPPEEPSPDSFTPVFGLSRVLETAAPCPDFDGVQGETYGVQVTLEDVRLNAGNIATREVVVRDQPVDHDGPAQVEFTVDEDWTAAAGGARVGVRYELWLEPYEGYGRARAGFDFQGVRCEYEWAVTYHLFID